MPIQQTFRSGLLTCALLASGLPAGATGPARISISEKTPDRSLQNEVQHAVGQGLKWLQTRQNAEGFWSAPAYPALTALALTACQGDPARRGGAAEPAFVVNGYDFLRRCARADGGIYQKDLASYNTAIAMMALLLENKPANDPLLRKARRFMVGQQQGVGPQGKTAGPFAGGIGYGDDEPHSDMSNTVFALEALYYSKHLKEDPELREARDLDWPAVIGFIQRCQNLPSHNSEAWASDDPQNKGGFIYFPGRSMAGEMKLPSGKTALRSYGSMSYAGLLSYIYADLKRDDPRVQAVCEWLGRNFTLEENPGLGAQGLYYYYHTMAKALAAYGAEELPLADGKKVAWRRALALKLLNLQHPEGFWVNENGRWWEKDPVLVTSYALIALEIIHRGL